MTTNYQMHFGDSLRAAETLAEANMCLKAFADAGDPEVCDGCPLMFPCGRCGNSVEKWLEWLENEVDE